MKTLHTDYGTVCIAEPPELYAAAAKIGREAWRTAPTGGFSWALTGGSTPKAWYRWCVDQRVLPVDLPATTHWFVSDERCMPLESDESNFGNAQRLLLQPLDVVLANQHPWPVALPPPDAARVFTGEVERVCGPDRSFSLCFLGLGDDAHTASLFPGSPLLAAGALAKMESPLFAAIEAPGKGWRLTVTPAGLRRCDQIVVMATAAAKAEAVRRVFRSDKPVSAVPAKVLRSCAPRVTWLVDPTAATALSAP